jgi:hypothetical protein
MALPKALVWLALCTLVAGCASAGTPNASASPTLAVRPAATASASPAVSAEPTSPSPTPTAQPSLLPVPAPSLVCPNQYQVGHQLVVAPQYSLAGYVSLDVLDVADPFAPRLVCTLNNSPYPLQPIQWLSASDFLLTLSGQAYRLLEVDVARESVTTFRELEQGVFLTSLSPDRAWLATMVAGGDGTEIARLSGPPGVRSLVTYPPAGGHGGTIYGFGGPNVEFSPDGSLVMAVDFEANRFAPAVPNLQVFDLNGSRVASADKASWAVWAGSSLYYDGGDGKVYKWVRGSLPVVVLQSDWLEPNVSADGQAIAYLASPGGSNFTLNMIDTRSGAVTTVRASGQRIDPLFVNAAVIWTSELVDCANCYGGNNPTGKVFAYDSATRNEHQVALPELLAPLAGASASIGP